MTVGPILNFIEKVEKKYIMRTSRMMACLINILTLSLPEGFCFIDYLFARGFSKKLLYY
jgi:hypothetical protein